MTDTSRLLFLRFYLILMLLSSSVAVSQSNYSELALTGRVDLELVGGNYKLQEEVQIAFVKMKSAARKEGVLIEIVSEYRSFERQLSIWNRKYQKFISSGFSPEAAVKKNIQYSTLPGTSRHHWGTDVDVIDGFVKMPRDVLIEENFLETGVYSKLKKWMNENSEKFGFYLVYTDDPNRKGFKHEPWHYSYKPLSDILLKEFSEIDLVYFFKTVKINGMDHISEDFLDQYIEENMLGINPLLK